MFNYRFELENSTVALFILRLTLCRATRLSIKPRKGLCVHSSFLCRKSCFLIPLTVFNWFDAGGDASGSVKCPAAENTSNLSEKQYKGFPGSSTMHYSGFPQMTAGHEESANYGAASFLHSKGMLSASTPSVEWKSGPTGNSSSPFEASGDELLPDRGSPLRSLDFSGGCQRRQVPELTRGVKCVRGAARATVQQLYGQMYDLEALAVELDRANIDDLDPGDFDRSYHHGKRFAVGDLGRKLLLIVVREKLEVRPFGEVKVQLHWLFVVSGFFKGTH